MAAKVIVIYWRNIPSMVEARDGAAVHKTQLSARFQELIDVVAMRKGLVGSDGYLEQWHRVRQDDQAGDPQEIANAVAAALERRFDAFRAAAIADVKSD